MTAKANLDMMEVIVSKLTDKFIESINIMMREFTKCVSEAISGKIAAVESRLGNIENLLSCSSDPGSSPFSPTAVANVVTKAVLDFENQRAEMTAKSVNVIISGLPPSTDTSDVSLVERFCEENLTIKPRVIRARRLGKGNGTGPPKLCVSLENPGVVDSLIDAATILRHNPHHSHVFINRDLTRAQAEAAYKARVTRRSGHLGSRPTPSTLPTPSSAGTDPPFSS